MVYKYPNRLKGNIMLRAKPHTLVFIPWNHSKLCLNLKGPTSAKPEKYSTLCFDSTANKVKRNEAYEPKPGLWKELFTTE